MKKGNQTLAYVPLPAVARTCTFPFMYIYIIVHRINNNNNNNNNIISRYTQITSYSPYARILLFRNETFEMATDVVCCVHLHKLFKFDRLKKNAIELVTLCRDRDDVAHWMDPSYTNKWIHKFTIKHFLFTLAFSKHLNYNIENQNDHWSDWRDWTILCVCALQNLNAHEMVSDYMKKRFFLWLIFM